MKREHFCYCLEYNREFNPDKPTYPHAVVVHRFKDVAARKTRLAIERGRYPANKTSWYVAKATETNVKKALELAETGVSWPITLKVERPLKKGNKNFTYCVERLTVRVNGSEHPSDLCRIHRFHDADTRDLHVRVGGSAWEKLEATNQLVHRARREAANTNHWPVELEVEL